MLGVGESVFTFAERSEMRLLSKINRDFYRVVLQYDTYVCVFASAHGDFNIEGMHILQDAALL